MSIDVGIIEDHPAMLLGTMAILNRSDDIRVVAHGTTVGAVLRYRHPLSVILLDLSLADGTSPTGNIQALAPLGAPVIAYTSGERPHLIREAARAGASGMIRKSDRIDLIADAVRRAARGEIVASPDWAAALESDRDFVSAQLSPREAEVLSLYASGETAKQVAQLLYLSPETVIDHVRRIRAKYAAVDRAAPTKVDLFRRAVEDGLVAPEN